ncbi:hypothetical protein ACFOHK_08130 [Falsigemmobacter intermedius]|uniref:Uncharacterized protein n=1 Tax=Falsigemmobacter intermedius TaxID=1553448 RepID=A0A3S3Y9V4_9RHOB|nr:hypothetical protein [Falsigemmobacter intermedius]RWY36436.1 hypothetical protein EP867_17900 [Falsigemmobacter intermedius]
MRKAIWATILALCVTGCVRVDQTAVCDGSRLARAEHAAALAQDGGDRSVVTGARLIRLIDVGCADGGN